MGKFPISYSRGSGGVGSFRGSSSSRPGSRTGPLSTGPMSRVERVNETPLEPFQWVSKVWCHPLFPTTPRVIKW